ncbi:MAG: transcription elongation factor subunit Spt4 [Candidatus Aenigmatarchaeota archaeon]
MVKRVSVCRNCKRFTTEKECPICKSKNLSLGWKGLVIINDPQDSEIARILEINVPGKYALFVD